MTRLREQLLQWSVPVALACALLLAAGLGGALLLTGLVLLVLKAAMITLLFAWFRWRFPPVLALGCAGPMNFGGPTIAAAFALVLLLGAIGFDLTATVATLVALWLGLGLHPRLRQAVASTLHEMLNPRTAITADASGSEHQPPPPVLLPAAPELSQRPVLALPPRRIRTPFSLRFAIAEEADIAGAIRLALEAVQTVPDLIAEPPPHCRVAHLRVGAVIVELGGMILSDPDATAKPTDLIRAVVCARFADAGVPLVTPNGAAVAWWAPEI